MPQQLHKKHYVIVILHEKRAVVKSKCYHPRRKRRRVGKGGRLDLTEKEAKMAYEFLGPRKIKPPYLAHFSLDTSPQT